MTPRATLEGQRAACGACFAKALNFRGTQRLLESLAKPAERQLSILLDGLSAETPIPRSSQTTLVTDSSITKPLSAFAVGIYWVPGSVLGARDMQWILLHIWLPSLGWWTSGWGKEDVTGEEAGSLSPGGPRGTRGRGKGGPRVKSGR